MAATTRRTRKAAQSQYSRKGRELTEITIRTLVPEKWLFVDQETGETWMREGDIWKRANVSVLVLPNLSSEMIPEVSA